MKLSPLDIQHMEFSSGLSGYSKKQVREFLSELSLQTEDLLRENQVLRDEMQKKEEHIDELKNAEIELKRTVVIAERIGNEMKQNAQREAELTLKEAEHKREKVLRDAQMRIKQANAEIARLEKEQTLFREQFRGMLRAFERSIDAVPSANIKKAAKPRVIAQKSPQVPPPAPEQKATPEVSTSEEPIPAKVPTS